MKGKRLENKYLGGKRKTDGNRQIKEVRKTKMGKFKERFSISHQLFLCPQITDIT